jgi:hypothetical protein
MAAEMAAFQEMLKTPEQKKAEEEAWAKLTAEKYGPKLPGTKAGTPAVPSLTLTPPTLEYKKRSYKILEEELRLDLPGVEIKHEEETEKKKKDEEKPLQRRSQDGTKGDTVARNVPPIVHEVLQSPGQPLDPETRAFFEPRFGTDFSQVRVHTDARATESARTVGALAYTAGLNVVLGAGIYRPLSPLGQRLLAHELTHVIQQIPSKKGEELTIDPSSSAEQEADQFASVVTEPSSLVHIPNVGKPVPQSLTRSLQRSKDRCSGTGATCAASEQCIRPDLGKEGSGVNNTRWELEVNIDVERSNWQSALRNEEFGHTYVRFWEASGREYTYGFYPASELPNENRSIVAGCVHHPDTTHDSCIDDTVSYSLKQEQYNAGLTFAQHICRDGHSYGAAYTCTTYAEDVVRASGKVLPSSRSRPTTVFYQPIPAIDNPNTLLENVRATRGALSTDEGIRNWVNARESVAIGDLPTVEMIRMINRLLDGWVSDEDVHAINRICQSVRTTTQMARIRAAIEPRILDLTDIGQRTRVRIALARTP